MDMYGSLSSLEEGFSDGLSDFSASSLQYDFEQRPISSEEDEEVDEVEEKTPRLTAWDPDSYPFHHPFQHPFDKFTEDVQQAEQLQNLREELFVINQLVEELLKEAGITAQPPKVSKSMDSLPRLDDPLRHPTEDNITNSLTIAHSMFKKIAFIYLSWLLASYFFVLLLAHATRVAPTICAFNFLQSYTPFCNLSVSPTKSSDTSYSLDISKLANTQSEFTYIAERMHANSHMTRDMIGNHFAMRDLKIRVTASKISRKQELANELQSLIDRTYETAKGMSQFTVKIDKTIDTVNAFNAHSVKSLEGIADRNLHPPSISSQVVAAIHPTAAIQLLRPDRTEAELKEVLTRSATRISMKVNHLKKVAYDVTSKLNVVQEILNRIQEIAYEELGGSGHTYGRVRNRCVLRRTLLSDIWTYLEALGFQPAHVRADGKTHEEILTDVVRFLENSAVVMEDTTAVLNRIEAELDELRDDFARPGLILQDYPLGVILWLLRESSQRLETAKRELQNTDNSRLMGNGSGGRGYDTRRHATATVNVTTSTLA